MSLRIWHPCYDPEFISSKIEMEPKHAWKANTPRRSPDGHFVEGVYDSTYCSFPLNDSSDVSLPVYIKKCSRSLYRHKDFFHDIRASGGRVEYFIGLFLQNDSGETFDVTLLKDLADLQIELGLCLYLPESNTELL